MAKIVIERQGDGIAIDGDVEDPIVVYGMLTMALDLLQEVRMRNQAQDAAARALVSKGRPNFQFPFGERRT